MIDTCIHYRWDELTDVLHYMTKDWQEYVGRPGSLPLGAGAKQLIPFHRYPNPAGDYLPELTRPGYLPGADLALMKTEVLDRYGVTQAIIVPDEAMFAPANPNPFVATALTQAINDWTVDRWLSEDSRLHGAVLAPIQIPADGAAEIKRLGAHPQIVAVLMATAAIGKLIGHPLYDPIYEAAEEMDLTILVHSGGDGVADTATSPAAGHPRTFAEYTTLAPLNLMSQVMSLIAHGVPAKHPRLRFLLVGSGYSWVPGLLRRLDMAWRATRREVPWIVEPPSEYFAKHFRVTTYGSERNADGKLLRRFTMAHREMGELLCFGSGYPDWDACMAPGTAAQLPESWQTGVFEGNATAWFPWSSSTPAAGTNAALRSELA